MNKFTYRVVNAFVNNNNNNNNNNKEEEEEEEEEGHTQIQLLGNPAAVIVLDAEKSNESESTSKAEKQMIARKLGFSETAFIWEDLNRQQQGSKCFHIEWFSPTNEIGLCGHATLASAACIFNDIYCSSESEPIVFIYEEGRNELRLERCDATGAITMSFPASPLVSVDAKEASRRFGLVREAFGDSCTSESSFPVYENSIGDTFIYITETLVSSVDEIYFDSKKKVDYEKLKKVGGRGVVVTALSIPEKKETVQCDFKSRFFGPNIGIDEDPVTGSAHCGLAPFYSSKLSSSFSGGGKFLRGYQKSSRGGLVLCRAVGDRVELRGFCAFDNTDTVEI